MKEKIILVRSRSGLVTADLASSSISIFDEGYRYYYLEINGNKILMFEKSPDGWYFEYKIDRIIINNIPLNIEVVKCPIQDHNGEEDGLIRFTYGKYVDERPIWLGNAGSGGIDVVDDYLYSLISRILATNENFEDNSPKKPIPPPSRLIKEGQNPLKPKSIKK